VPRPRTQQLVGGSLQLHQCLAHLGAVRSCACSAGLRGSLCSPAPRRCLLDSLLRPLMPSKMFNVAAAVLVLALRPAAASSSPTSSSPPPDNRPCYTSKTIQGQYNFTFCANSSWTASGCSNPQLGGQNADGSCVCSSLGCAQMTPAANSTVALGFWALSISGTGSSTSPCTGVPTYVAVSLPLTGTFTPATSGSGYAAASVLVSGRTIKDWCAVANSKGSAQCKPCKNLTKLQVTIALSVTLPSVFILVAVMWWTGFCCCPPPPNSYGARRRQAKLMQSQQWQTQSGVGAPSAPQGNFRYSDSISGGVQMGRPVYNLAQPPGGVFR